MSFVLQALTDYRAELRDDPIISTHLAKLYDNLLEQNLIRVIEPFSRVQVRLPGNFLNSFGLHVIAVATSFSIFAQIETHFQGYVCW